MKRSETKGVCAYCKKEIPKNQSSILNHLSQCDERKNKKKPSLTRHIVLILEGAYAPDYWLVIKARPNTTMQTIDGFIKDIWVECCGHMSRFSDGNSEIAFSKKAGNVFFKGVTVNYEYDFGTPTEVSLSFLGEIDDSDDTSIQVLFRNKEIEVKCSYCGNRATEICPSCIGEEEGLLCESCKKTHECVEENGEDYLLPLVNSPRAGECGYTGSFDKDIKKYFPREII